MEVLCGPKDFLRWTEFLLKSPSTSRIQEEHEDIQEEHGDTKYQEANDEDVEDIQEERDDTKHRDVDDGCVEDISALVLRMRLGLLLSSEHSRGFADMQRTRGAPRDGGGILLADSLDVAAVLDLDMDPELEHVRNDNVVGCGRSRGCSICA